MIGVFPAESHNRGDNGEDNEGQYGPGHLAGVIDDPGEGDGGDGANRRHDDFTVHDSILRVATYPVKFGEVLMDWLMLVLILGFIFWSFQMIIVYRRQIERYDDQIAQVQTNTEEVTGMVEKYEADHAEKKEELDTLRQEAEGLEKKEKELGEKINTLKQAGDSRQPTRFRLDNVDPSGD